MKANYLLGAAFCVALVVFVVAVFQAQQSIVTSPALTPTQTTISASTQTNSASSSVNTGSTISAGNSYTLTQVATHNDASSCWSAINGNVYDLTSWIDQHPGGPEAILSICGSDGSAAFNAQHGGQAQPAAELQQFYIGVLTS